MFKKMLLLLLAITFLSGQTALAATEAKGSGVISSSAAVSTAVCPANGSITQLFIHTDGTNDATVTLYDNTAGSGTQITPAIVCSGSANQCGVDWTTPRTIQTGVYVTISGTGATAIVECIPR